MDNTREKLIDLLRDCIRVDTEKKEAWIIGGKVGRRPSVFENMADHLIANGVTIATDNNVGDKWIPVSERLPKEFISVLVHIPEMNPCPAVMEAYRIGDGWVTKMAAFDINCATHWMPLPEPPKGE